MAWNKERTAWVAAEPHGFDDLLEGEILVGERIENDGLGSLEELSEAPFSRELAPEDERIDEEADESFGLGAGPSGDRGSDGDVVLSREAMKKGLECGNEGHEEGSPFMSGDVPKFIDQGSARMVERSLP